MIFSRTRRQSGILHPFISLNQRSLVGGITSDRKRIETSFLERLLDQMYGVSRPLQSGHLANLVQRRSVVKSSELRESSVQAASPERRPRMFAHAPANVCLKRYRLYTCVEKHTSRFASCVAR